MQLINIMIAAAGAAALALAAPATSAPQRAGKSGAQAKTSVNRPKPSGGGAQAARQAPKGNQARSGGSGKQVSNKQAYKAGQASGNRNNRDVVVVNNGNAGHGYYDNGRYHDNDWDNDDNDFLEFVGKTAAITAGVSIVSAVIGDVVKDKPADCTPINVGGQPYLNCNGVAYQQVPGGYQVVAPPR